MNLVPMNTTTQTMSSREIADLTGKEHKHVMRDIRDMAEALEAGSSFGLSTYVDVTGRTRDCYLLPKRETLILVSGYSVELRARIIDRWQELEAQVASTPAIPTNFVEALRLAADEAERRMAAEAALKEAMPVIAVGTRVASHKDRSISRYARTLEGVNSMRTKSDLFEAGYFYKQVNTYRVYAKYRQTHFIEKADPATGKVDIYLGPKGYEVLAQMHEEGRLTKLKAYA